MASDIAVIGLGVMGRNIALNLADHGFQVTLYNRSWQKTQDTLQRVTAEQRVVAVKTLAQLCDSLNSPRIIFLMLTAGPAVDAVIEELLPLLDKG
ncbi:MAG: NAD(P)-binding domain-containing protein, partial [Gammaproteobacteria bacterium]|nr:NAD(P)-binding domain-containing protein [Gammaproteobacteria bacterium]